MPTYQYACTECGHRLEAVQRFSDPALTECPECAGRLRKVFSSVGVVFKGSGFYRTDSRASANGKNGSAPAKDSKDSKDAKGGAKSDAAKPESAGSSGDSAKSGTKTGSASSTSAPTAKSA